MKNKNVLVYSCALLVILSMLVLPSLGIAQGKPGNGAHNPDSDPESPSPVLIPVDIHQKNFAYAAGILWNSSIWPDDWRDSFSEQLNSLGALYSPMPGHSMQDDDLRGDYGKSRFIIGDVIGLTEVFPDSASVQSVYYGFAETESPYVIPKVYVRVKNRVKFNLKSPARPAGENQHATLRCKLALFVPEFNENMVAKYNHNDPTKYSYQEIKFGNSAIRVDYIDAPVSRRIHIHGKLSESSEASPSDFSWPVDHRYAESGPHFFPASQKFKFGDTIPVEIVQNFCYYAIVDEGLESQELPPMPALSKSFEAIPNIEVTWESVDLLDDH